MLYIVADLLLKAMITSSFDK